MEVNIETLVVSSVFEVYFGTHQRTALIRTVELHNNDELYFFEEPEGSMAKHAREKVYVDGAHVIDCGSPGRGGVSLLALFLKDYDYAEHVDTLGNRKDTIFEPPKQQLAGASEAERLARCGCCAVVLGTRTKASKWSFLRALQKASHEYTSLYPSPVAGDAPASLPHVRNRFDDVLRGVTRSSDSRRNHTASRSPSSSSSVSVLSDHEVLQLQDVLRAYDANQAARAMACESPLDRNLPEDEELPLAACTSNGDEASPLTSPTAASAGSAGGMPKRLATSPLYAACLEAQPANHVCADCEEPFPTWCVLQPFGVFVCIDCVGVHRRLWANKCREAEMDKWNAKDVAFMASRGNAIANGELEYDVSFPDGSVEANTGTPPPCKPYRHFSKAELRESYIRWKYEEQLFTQAMHPLCTDPPASPPRDPAGVQLAVALGDDVDTALCVSCTVDGSFSPPPGEDVSAALAPPRYTALVKLILKELSADACFTGATCVMSNGFQELHSKPGRKLMSITTATAWDEPMQIGIENPCHPLFFAVYNAKAQLMAAGEFTLPQSVVEGSASMLSIPLPWCELDKKNSQRRHKVWQLTALVTFSELQ